jgi:16S rRNA (uracil1498-N3)-methyltransferase
MADRFYINSALSPGLVSVSGPEAHHLAVVCRLRPGDAVTLFNGDGHEYPGRVASVAKKSVTIDIQGIASPERELPFRLTFAVPLPKGDRADVLVEKLTELGVTDLVPLSTARSVVHPRDAKLERLQRHVIEASKQCGRNVLMQIHPVTAWADFCRTATGVRVLAHVGETVAISEIRKLGEDVTAAVGPEGGFTEEEVFAARAAGWQAVGLGRTVLRVETAALALAVLCGR